MLAVLFMIVWLCCVSLLREAKVLGQSVSLLTLRGDFTLSGPLAGGIAELVQMFLEGLRDRSCYAVALQDASSQGQTSS